MYVLVDNRERWDTIGLASGIVLCINYIEGCVNDDLTFVLVYQVAATLSQIAFDLAITALAADRAEGVRPSQTFPRISKACGGTSKYT